MVVDTHLPRLVRLATPAGEERSRDAAEDVKATYAILDEAAAGCDTGAGPDAASRRS